MLKEEDLLLTGDNAWNLICTYNYFGFTLWHETVYNDNEYAIKLLITWAIKNKKLKDMMLLKTRDNGNTAISLHLSTTWGSLNNFKLLLETADTIPNLIEELFNHVTYNGKTLYKQIKNRPEIIDIIKVYCEKNQIDLK